MSDVIDPYRGLILFIGCRGVAGRVSGWGFYGGSLAYRCSTRRVSFIFITLDWCHSVRLPNVIFCALSASSASCGYNCRLGFPISLDDGLSCTHIEWELLSDFLRHVITMENNIFNCCYGLDEVIHTFVFTLNILQFTDWSIVLLLCLQLYSLSLDEIITCYSNMSRIWSSIEMKCRQRESNPSISRLGYGTLTIEPRTTL